MLKCIRKPLCLLLAGLMLAAAGCGNSQNSGTQESTQEYSTQPAATVEPTLGIVEATSDSAQIDDSKISFNTLEIKRNVGEIEDTLDGIVDKYKFNGSLYVQVGNDFDYIRANGSANQGAHYDNSIYRSNYVGSVTKLFTAVAVMKLAEEKKLSLDDTIDKYFPGCAYAKSVTVRQLLDMTSGIPNYIDRGSVKCLVPQLEAKLGNGQSRDKNHDAIRDWILAQKPESPGEFRYSDSNYYLLGDVIAAASKKSYEEYMQTAVFTPADMKNTGFEENDNTARPYTGNTHSAVLLRGGVGYSSLGLITNVSDLLRFVDSLMLYHIINQDSLGVMFTDYGNGYGFGAHVNGSRVSCVGELDAYTAKLSFTADRSQIFVAESNYSHTDINFIHRLFRNYMLKYRN